MKRYLTVLAVLSCVLFSCSEEDSEEVSKWQLIEQLTDPGDGSGTFQPVESDKTITFFEDGTFSSNASVCYMETQVGSGSTGTYDESDMIMYVNDCNMGTSPIAYEMDGAYMIVNYPCIEPCREKYAMVQ